MATQVHAGPYDETDLMLDRRGLRRVWTTLPVVEKIQASPRGTRSGLVAAITTLAALMDLLDGTAVNVALPTVQRELHADATDVRWIVSGYLPDFAATLITAGRLGDLFGRRRLFLAGVASFGVASLLSGIVQTPSELVAGRLVQAR